MSTRSETSTRGSLVVYGLSSEGYEIASRLAAKGFKLSIIDETLGTTMDLRPEIAEQYPDLKTLLADEVLVQMKPQKGTLASAKVIFFSPKIRRREEDVLAETRTRVGEISRHIAPGTLVIFCLPVGLGGSREIIERLERGSGLVGGKDLFFAYAPIDGGKSHVLGSNDNLKQFESYIKAAGLATELFKLPKAELVHAQRIVSRHTSLSSQLESARRLTSMALDSPDEYREIFAEDLNALLFDLKVIMNSLESGEPFLYLGSGSMKSVESYPRFLVDRIREMVRLKDLKAARLRIVLFTDADYLEIRGDKLNMANDLVNRLKDFFSDIDYVNIMKEGFTLPMGVDRNYLFVFLSGSAEQKLTKLYEEQISVTKPFMLRANLPVEFL